MEGILKQVKETHEIPSNAEDVLKNLQDDINNLGAKIPPNLVDQLSNIIITGKVDEESLAKIDQEELQTVISQQLIEKCTNVTKSAEEGAKNALIVRDSAIVANDCLTPLTDFSNLEDEIEVLKKNGSLEIAFNK